MNIPGVRSPSTRVGELVYFGRMLDKARVHARGELPPDYAENLGVGFDGSCIEFLGLDYAALTRRVLEGGSDEEVLQWCFAHGRRPSDGEIFVWNEFMRKRGWNDDIAPRLISRKKEGGMAGRSEIQTMFDFIDADEGRPVPARA
ncbi:MAG: DUF5069 domain-containing protein [Verrucomicrobiota bacterium]|nr:DUF5069 domain-containing protein [Verrucomicrobiota bacterium]